MNRQIVLYTAVLLVVAVILAMNIYLVDQPRTVTVKQNILLAENKQGYASLVLTASYNIRVYRDNKLIAERTKLNDPISIQWYRLIANMMFGFNRIGGVSWLDTTGSAYVEADTGYGGTGNINRGYPEAYIALGSGSGTPSINDYKLFNEKVKDKANMTVVVDDTNSRYIVTYTKTFTVANSFTLTEAGLELKVFANGDYRYVLIAHDSVNPSVDLVTGDSVAITYNITIPYSTNGPFTRWFYNVLIDLWLGYKGTTGNALSFKSEDSNTYTTLDTNRDGYEYTYIEIGNASSTINPLFETYSLSGFLQRQSTASSQSIASVNETGNYTLQYIVSFTFTSSASVREVGLSYYAVYTVSLSYYHSYPDKKGYMLWLYWSLPQPINVNAGDGLRVVITITIPYT